MKRLFSLLVVLSLFTFLGWGVAISGEMHLPPYKGSQAFESMKTLEGAWEGIHARAGKEEPARVEYKVSSNGSTIIETLFPGTTYEMISVYHDKEGKLSMTHYCSIGNQPEMDLVKTDGNTLEFALSPTAHIDVAKDGHMHGMKMIKVDDNHLVHHWTLYQEGKDGGLTELKLARVQ